MMKVNNLKLIVRMVALSLALPLALTTGHAQSSQPSAKVTAKTANLTLLPATTTQGQWQTVLANTIKTANQKDLFISASFEVGLFTDTLVRSKLMVSDTSTAQASVKVRVLIDGARVVEPGEVVFGRRTQTLSATLEGAIAGCLSIVPQTVPQPTSDFSALVFPLLVQMPGNCPVPRNSCIGSTNAIPVAWCSTASDSARRC